MGKCPSERLDSRQKSVSSQLAVNIIMAAGDSVVRV